MPLAWPSVAHIVEARLRIVAPSYGRRGDLDMSSRYGAQLSEVWAGDIVVAPMSRLQMLTFEAWRAQLRGRFLPFRVPATAGFLTPSVTASGTLTVAASCGADTITASLTAARTLPAGTLLTLGANGDVASWQTLELLEAAVTTGSAQVLKIAPRIRHTFAIGAAVSTSGVYFRMRLAADDAAFSDYNVSTGSTVISVVEAVGAAGDA